VTVESQLSVIRPDDLVEIRVNDLEGPGVETVKVARVRRGQVAVPHVGPVKAEGLTPEQLESTVVRAYRDASLLDSASVRVRKLSRSRQFDEASGGEPARR
jgi:protein involved in polysaccharide export with SLBB domain